MPGIGTPPNGRLDGDGAAFEGSRKFLRAATSGSSSSSLAGEEEGSSFFDGSGRSKASFSRGLVVLDQAFEGSVFSTGMGGWEDRPADLKAPALTYCDPFLVVVVGTADTKCAGGAAAL
jgi:hypothetical protein